MQDFHPSPKKKAELVLLPRLFGGERSVAVTKRMKEFVQSIEKKNITAAYDQARTRWLDYLGYRGIDPIDVTDKLGSSKVLHYFPKGN